MIEKHIAIVPVGKPRQSQRDRWAKRPAVARYRAFADELRVRVGPVPQNASSVTLRAFLPIPASWSKRKRAAMRGQPHTQKPDIDNIAKAVLDALFPDDSGIHRLRAGKYWEDLDGPGLIITIE